MGCSQLPSSMRIWAGSSCAVQALVPRGCSRQHCPQRCNIWSALALHRHAARLPLCGQPRSPCCITTASCSAAHRNAAPGPRHSLGCFAASSSRICSARAAVMLLVDAGGLHLRGQPLCHQLEDLGARFLKTCKSSPGEGIQSHAVDGQSRLLCLMRAIVSARPKWAVACYTMIM